MTNALLAHQYNTDMAPLIQDISDPLLVSFGITHFGLIKMNAEQKMLRIANHDAWNKIYMENEFYNDLRMYDMASVPLNGTKRRILTGLPKTEHEKILYEQNLWHFLLIYERTEKDGSFFFFGTTRDNQAVVDYYISYPHIFDHFIYYFKEKMASFLIFKKENCIQLKINPLEAKNPDEQKLLKDFYDKTKISKFLLGSNFNNIQLSKREAECVFHLAHGKTAKEIARILKISHRTIEYFIENIRLKTGITRKSELVAKLFSVALSFNQSEKNEEN